MSGTCDTKRGDLAFDRYGRPVFGSCSGTRLVPNEAEPFILRFARQVLISNPAEKGLGLNDGFVVKIKAQDTS